MITLRLGVRQMEEKAAKELIEAIKRHNKSCDTVWITTEGLYPSLDKHREDVEKWKKVTKLFRDAGIKVSLQIQNTIGHGDFYGDTDSSRFDGMRYDGKIVGTIKGPDGTENISCFCWNSPQFKNYIKNVVAMYAEEIKPDTIWFDDDLRAANHFPNEYCCFCDNCIAKFNELYGSDFTREALVTEINYGDVLWRKRYIDFCRKGIYDFIYEVAKAGSEVSPDTHFALEYEHNINYMGTDDDFILKALYDAGGYPVKTRPGGSHYNDKTPWGQFYKAMNISYSNSLLPSYVDEYHAELEDLPGAAFGKSIGGTVNEATLYLAAGCMGVTFTDVQFGNEPMSFHEKLFAEFTANREYWESLSVISKNYYRGGLCIFVGKESHLRKLSPDEKAFSWVFRLHEDDFNLLRVGIPLTYDKRKPSAYLLHYGMIDGLTDEDIKFLLTKPVITDGESIKKLCERGYGKYFNMDLICADNDASYEVFSDHPINKNSAGMKFSESHYTNPHFMHKYFAEGHNVNCEVTGYLYNAYNEKLGSTSLITEICDTNNKNKVKWAIFGYCIWNDIISAAKRNQILNSIDYISPLPAMLLSAEQAAVIPSVDEDGKTVSVTVASASQGGTYELELLIRNPKGTKITVMSTKHNRVEPINVEFEDGDLYVTLPMLQPYELATVFIN